MVKQSLGTVGYQQAEPGAGQQWLFSGELSRAEDEVQNPARTTDRVPASRHIDGQDGWASLSGTSVDVARDVTMTTGERMSSQQAVREGRVMARRCRGKGAARQRGGVLAAAAEAPIQEGRR